MAAFGQIVHWDTTTWSPWFPRQGNNCVFRAQLIKMEVGGSNLEFDIDVYHKNVEDSGDGGSASAQLVLDETTTDGEIVSVTATDLKELVRFKYSFFAGEGQAGDWVDFRMLTPAWYNANRA